MQSCCHSQRNATSFKLNHIRFASCVSLCPSWLHASRVLYHLLTSKIFPTYLFFSFREINFRRQAFSARYSEVFQKSEGLYRECLKVRLSHIIRWTKKKTTDHIADKIANKLSEEHSGEALQFVIAVYRDFGYPMKTKSSARHVIANQDGVHVAVFPLEGSFRKSVNSNLVDEFCNTSIPGAGDKTFCDVGSVDGVFVYDRLRNEEIVPLQSELAVIPKAGRLAVRKIPPQSLSGLHLKSYPDFDILLF